MRQTNGVKCPASIELCSFVATVADGGAAYLSLLFIGLRFTISKCSSARCESKSPISDLRSRSSPDSIVFPIFRLWLVFLFCLAPKGVGMKKVLSLSLEKGRVLGWPPEVFQVCD
jgi:hypothetical protein